MTPLLWNRKKTGNARLSDVKTNAKRAHKDIEPDESWFVPRIQQDLLSADTLAARGTHLLLADDDPASHADLMKRVAALQLDDILEHVACRSADSVHFAAAIVDGLVAQGAASDSHKHAAIGAFQALPVEHSAHADVTRKV
jgi:hypothetical protein